LGNDLGIENIEGRQNGKDGKFAIKAVHTQIIKGEKSGIGNDICIAT